MSRQKKTALDKACEEISSLFYEVGCCNCSANCGLKNTGLFVKKVCIKNLKQYFQEQADIPDGWDIIKETIKQLKNTKLPYKIADAYVLEKLCWEYGIEVKNNADTTAK